MQSELATILISLLLLISPVSLSSEQIPDFTPECALTSVHAMDIAVAPLDGAEFKRCVTLPPEIVVYTFTTANFSALGWSKSGLFGRAPPA